jgi:dihydrofolate reductase
MRKVVLLINTTLDGFAAGSKGDLDWTIVDEDMWSYTNALFSTVDTTLFGRVTYQGFESYWPTVPANPNSTKETITFAHWIDKVQKVVFSKTLEHVTWNNTRLVRDNVAEEVSSLKAQAGKDIIVMGSPGLVHTLLELSLIDELRVNVNPVLLGSGIPFLNDMKDRTKLDLINAKTFQSGVVGLHYATKHSSLL